VPSEDPPHQKKHLARNVPRDFDVCVERERVRLEGRGRDARRVSNAFYATLRSLSDGSMGPHDQERLAEQLHEVRLRYLVLSKTLDQRVPPTEIMKQLRSLRNRTQEAARVLKDDDRDATVAMTMGLENPADIPDTDEAFRDANTLAERAAIAQRIVEKYASYINELSEFFNYKADLYPKGNQTTFGMIYAVNALGAMFERENGIGRSATISKNVSPVNSDEGAYRFTGPFLEMLTEFFHAVDDSQLSGVGTKSFRERARRLSMHRKKDPDLHLLLHGQVTVEIMLEFMSRAEAVR
jgi:hypothetical protein